MGYDAIPTNIWQEMNGQPAPEDEVRVDVLVKCQKVLDGDCHNVRCGHFDGHKHDTPCRTTGCFATKWVTKCVPCGT